MTVLSVVTWNIHRARGADGQVRPDRIAAAIEQAIAPLAPDILALQEADEALGAQRRLLDLERIGRATGTVPAQSDPLLRWGPDSHGFQGTVLMLSPRLAVRHAALVDLPGVWPRGAVAVDLEAESGPFRLLAVHLSLSQALRMAQMRTLAQYHARRPAMPLLLVGDLNEWRPWSGLAFAPRIVGSRLHGPALATFPARRPLLPLDRVLADRPGAVTQARALRAPIFRQASDHLPLAATVSLRPAATSG